MKVIKFAIISFFVKTFYLFRQQISLDKLYFKNYLKQKLIIIINTSAQPDLLSGKNLSVISINHTTQFNTEQLKLIRTHCHKAKNILIQVKLENLKQENEDGLNRILSSLKNSLGSLAILFTSRPHITLEIIGLEQIPAFSYFFSKYKSTLLGIENHFKKIDSARLYAELKQSYCQLIQLIRNQALYQINHASDTKLKRELYLLAENLAELDTKILSIIKAILNQDFFKRQIVFKGIYFNGSSDHENTSVNFSRSKSLFQPAIQTLINNPTLNYQEVKAHIAPSLRIIAIVTLLILCITSMRLIQHEYHNALQLTKAALRINKALTLCEKDENIQLLSIINQFTEYPDFVGHSTYRFLALPHSYRLHEKLHQIINPLMSRIIYRLAPAYLEEKLLSLKLPLADRWAASLGYLSLKKPKYQHYLSDAICFFWLQQHKAKTIELCQGLRYWINPKLHIINEALIANAKTSFMENDLATRVFAHFYLRNHLNPHNMISLQTAFKKLEHMFNDSYSQHLFFIPFTRLYKLNMPTLLHSYALEAQFLDLEDEAEELWTNEQQLKFNKILRKTTLLYWKERLAQIHIKPLKSTLALENLSLMISKNHSSLQRLIHLISQYEPEWLSQSNIQLQYYDYVPIARWLKNIGIKLNAIEQSHNKASESYELLSSVLNNEANNAFSDIITISQSAPNPLKQWLIEIYGSAWNLLAEIYFKQVNKQWQNEILPFYNENIKNHYPLAQSELELSLTDFQYLFGPEQLIDSFFKEHLSPFFTSKADTLNLKSIDNLKLPIAASSFSFLNKLLLIKQNYFSEQTGLPRIEFSIEPIELNRATRRLELKLGSQQIIYQHGPQYPYKILWPSENHNAASLKLSSFNGHQDELNYQGDWGLFRLLDVAEQNNTPPNQSELSFIFPHQDCSFRIKSPAQFDVLSLALFKNLDFPTQLLLLKNSLGESYDLSQP